MKNTTLILFSILLAFFAKSQTISPSTNDEYCPNVEYTFTVQISKPFQSITTVGGCIITQQPSTPVGTTFNFKGKFNDANTKQTFKVYHTDGTQSDFASKKSSHCFIGVPVLPITSNLPEALMIVLL